MPKSSRGRRNLVITAIFRVKPLKEAVSKRNKLDSLRSCRLAEQATPRAKSAASPQRQGAANIAAPGSAFGNHAAKITPAALRNK